MADIYKPGVKLHSAVCETQIMALRIPAEPLDIQCGGVPMGTEKAESGKASPADDKLGGTLVGKRYVDAEDTMEFLCTRGGEGSIYVNGAALDIKQAKQLPSSD